MSCTRVTSCCETDIDSNYWFDSIQCYCSALAGRGGMPPCSACEGSSSCCPVCGVYNYGVNEVHDDPLQKVKDDYDRAMGIVG